MLTIMSTAALLSACRSCLSCFTALAVSAEYYEENGEEIAARAAEKHAVSDDACMIGIAAWGQPG